MRRRILVAVTAALLVLFGSLLPAWWLHRSARVALQSVLEERLAGAGETAALALSREQALPDAAWLRRLMETNGLEGAFLLDRSLAITVDATGAPRAHPNPLRVDLARAGRALAGERSLAPAYGVEGTAVWSAYFPVLGPNGAIEHVLAVEAGEAFIARQRELDRARLLAVLLSAAAAGALTLVGVRWLQAESLRRTLAVDAARGEAMSRMAAMVAHEIRNPLWVIRGTVELMQERNQARLTPEDRSALADVLGEVDRLRALTDDFLDLAGDKALTLSSLDLGAALGAVARAFASAHPAVAVQVAADGPATVEGDARRLHQVFFNLLANAAQAGARSIALRVEREGRDVQVSVEDDGPGIPADVRSRLFEPFVTTRTTGTGLGLALSHRIVDRHRGSLTCARTGPGGTTFVVRIPWAGPLPEEVAWPGS